ncbi:hypothetical protein D3C72_1820690 [compost metagenome]
MAYRLQVGEGGLELVEIRALGVDRAGEISLRGGAKLRRDEFLLLHGVPHCSIWTGENLPWAQGFTYCRRHVFPVQVTNLSWYKKHHYVRAIDTLIARSRTRRLPARPPGAPHPCRCGPAARTSAPHAGPAPRGSGATGRSQRHLGDVAGAGPAGVDVRPRADQPGPGAAALARRARLPVRAGGASRAAR